VTPLKSQTDFTCPVSSVKGKIQHKYFNGKYSHTIQVLEAEKNLIFGFSGVNDTAETDFGDFRSDYLGEYDAIFKTVLAC
jgi:hypothetical protein